jgi:hypothetical protein
MELLQQVENAASPSSLASRTKLQGVGLSVLRKLSSFPALTMAVLVLLVFCKCSDGLPDPDLWWHLLNAKHILTTLTFPNLDNLSFTAAGSSWLDHEWLSEIVYYTAFAAFGLRGVFVLFASLLGILFAAVFSITLRECGDPINAAITTAMGGLLAAVGFGPRTQTFGWLCFVAIYAILRRFVSGNEKGIWLIPLLFALWINCHGSWLIGLIIYGIFIAAGLVRLNLSRLVSVRWTPAQLKKLLLAGAVSVAALFINPFGYRLLWYPFDMMFRQSLNIANVEEWASVNFNDFRGKLVGFVLCSVFVAAMVGRKRWRHQDALLTAFVLYCGLTHLRFLLLAGIVLPPILALQLGALRQDPLRQEHRLVNSALLLLIIAVCLFRLPSQRILNKQVSDHFPQRAIDYLRAHQQPGRIFNFYEWGGYLELQLPNVKTFIDSRTDIFEYKGVLKSYLDIIRIQGSQHLLDRYGVSYILYPPHSSLSYFLSTQSGWQRIYEDKQAVLYRKVRGRDSCTPAPAS